MPRDAGLECILYRPDIRGSGLLDQGLVSADIMPERAI